jgi:Na+-driven multidrug efflux pump
MYTGTTNLIAAAQEKDRGVEGKPRTTKNLIAALQLSGFVGAGLGMILFVFARSLLRAIIGNDAINPEVFTAAMKYVRIRALGMPAAAIIGSSQAACLGMQDIKSPLYVLAAAAIINFFGDMTFVGSTHPWIGGAAGAAWATVFSQFAAVAFFMKWLCNKPKPTPNPKVVNLTNSINELMGTPSSKGKSRREKFRDDLRAFGKSRVSMTSTLTRKMSSLSKRLSVTNKTKKTELETSKEDSFSTRGFLEGKFRGRDFLTPPSKEKVADFAPYLLPVTTTQVGRVSGYVAMSHVVSSSLGTVSMAAQQVIVSLFYCLCPIADSLSLTAQSFLPSIVEKRVSRARANALRETIRNFWKAGAVFGAAMMAAVMCIPILSGFFTSDPAVITLVNSAAPLLLVFFAVHGVMCSSEGALLGQKDLSFLGKMYAAFFFAVPALMLRVKRAALSGKEVGLTAVWKVFLSYQLFRTVVWLVRAMQLQRRADRKVEIAEEASKIL